MLVAAFLIEILHVGKHVIELICVDLCVLPVAQQDHRVACHSIPAAAAHVCLIILWTDVGRNFCLF